MKTIQDIDINIEMHRILEKYVVTFISQDIDKNGYLVAVVPKDDFRRKGFDYQQIHFEGNTLEEALASVE